jgi:hypothetical protein
VADLDRSPLLADTMKKMPLAGALTDMFLAEVVPEAPCHLVVEDVVPVPDERVVVEGIRMRVAVAGEAEQTEETAVLHEQIRRDPRRPRRNWTPRWRITSTPTAEPQSLLRKLPRPAERLLLHLLSLMIWT